MQSYSIRKRNQKITVQEDSATSKMEIIKKTERRKWKMEKIDIDIKQATWKNEEM